MTSITCDFCDKFFVPNLEEGEVRCPDCGAVQNSAVATDFSNDPTELGTDQHILPKLQKEDPFEKETRMEKLSEPKKIPTPVWYDWKQYTPTLVICGILLVWVFYDRAVRLNEFEITLTYSVQSLNSDDLDSALKLADRALQLQPKSMIAQQLYDYIEKRMTQGRSKREILRK